ncbi:sterol desaturase family protein [Nocardioides sp. TRM66260-LWL]|uniref:sterol desaturase family protein n=1 Tax=Nocardioides sp. TRM66260-LWL TaxID=2874478 RepID=UPI001CC7A56B|nr:sterol desaturase family protein [Nocardioides sp. TRM66260-LWL]MBZ5734671.1 sterol desaturase family protein [Nocardioides sp. TRM66260-LWL]
MSPTELWQSLPEMLRDPVALAIPFFLVAVVLEAVAALLLEDERPAEARVAPDGRPIPLPGQYARKDAMASMLMGLVSVGTTGLLKAGALVVYAVLFAYVAPWHLPTDAWWSWALVILVVDFLFYWTHRVAHRVRLVWATHQAHHSSAYFTFATALRQKWNNTHDLVIWLPLPILGVPPAMIFAAFSLNLVYQFFVHTERVDRLWRPIELVFNTPSHHRVHHGCDPEYLDRNYAGILIVWDRLFGSFQEEIRRPTYGLTKPMLSTNIWTLQTHEYAAIARDVRSAATWREKLGYVFGPPGWTPAAQAPATSAAAPAGADAA